MTEKTRDPYDPNAPWPVMRGNLHNTGRRRQRPWGQRPGPVPGPRGEPSRLETGSSVSATPVIGADEQVYVGSADHYFYCWDPRAGDAGAGAVRWRFKTGEIIDSAAAIGADGTIYLVSGDASVYALHPATGECIWCLDFARGTTKPPKPPIGPGGVEPSPPACPSAHAPFTLSTIAWFEANVVLGSGGFLYAGNDDFYFYSIVPGEGQAPGKIRWSFPTGLNIWTAAGFSADGTVLYFISLDMHVYAVEAATGRLCWSRNVENLCASSPVVGPQGTIYFGSFDHHIYALEPRRGRVVWRRDVGGLVYATPALSPSGELLYVASSDASLYALDTRDGSVRWRFFLGMPCQNSASVGPDPEGGPEDYLIYVGSGVGSVYALDPEGRRRWSYEVVSEHGEFPASNSSMAIGAAGVATGFANNDVVYVPFDSYRQDRKGFDLDPGDGFSDHLTSGPRWFAMSPGGNYRGRQPIAGCEPAEGQPPPASSSLSGYPASTVSVRALALAGDGSGATVFPRLDPKTVEVQVEPPFDYRVVLSTDAPQVNVLPEELPGRDHAGRPLKYRITATTVEGGLVEGCFEQELAPAENTEPIESLRGHLFKIYLMSIYSPYVIPALDMIGIASLTIYVRIFEIDSGSDRVLAWGAEQFSGSGASGTRNLFYAFAGTYRDGNLLLETETCRFELTAMAVPLDRLRFAGALDGHKLPNLGASMAAEYRVTVLKLLGAVLRGSPGGGGWSLNGFFPPWSQIRNWALMLWRALPLVWRTVTGRLTKPWGLLDQDGRFIGLGTFKAFKARVPAGSAGQDTGARHVRIVYKKGFLGFGRRVEARLSGVPSPAPVFGICLLDLETFRPLFLDYSTLTKTVPEGDDAWVVTLSLPFGFSLGSGRIRVVVFAGLEPEVVGHRDLNHGRTSSEDTSNHPNH